jgi:hypothetical protein
MIAARISGKVRFESPHIGVPKGSGLPGWLSSHEVVGLLEDEGSMFLQNVGTTAQ